MSIKRIVLIFSLIITLFMLSGCAKYPEAEVQKAEQAVEDTKSAECDRYLVEEFNALQDSLNFSIAELKVQKEKSVFKRNYSEGKEMLNIVIDKAETIKEKIGARKEEVKAETEQIVIDYRAAHEDVKELISKLTKAKNTKPIAERRQIELNAIELIFEDVSAFIKKEDFMSAKQTAESTYVRIQSLKEELKQIVEKKNRK